MKETGSRKLAVFLGITLGVIFGVLAVMAVLAILLDPRPLIDEALRSRLKECRNLEIGIAATPRFKIWMGRIDRVNLHARDLKTRDLLIRDLQIELRDLALSPVRILGKDLRGVKRVTMTAGIILDEGAIASYLRSRSKYITRLEVHLVPGWIFLHPTIHLPFVSLDFTMKCALLVKEERQICLASPQESEGASGKYQSAIFDAVNPVLDIQKIDLSSIIFAHVNEEERNRWQSRVESLKVEKGVMGIRVRVEKR